MGFNYTFRADDVEGWDADTRDLVENRDRELELFFSAYEPTDNTSMVVSDTPPTTPAPQVGDQWFESDTGRTFVYYDNAWVEIGNATDIAGALQPGQVTALSAVTSLTSDDVFPVVDGPSSAVAASKITYGNLVTAMSTSLAPGLVLVKTQAISAGSSSANVTSAFSSSYDAYKITITGGALSATANISLKLGSTTTGYYSSRILNYPNNGTPVGNGENNTSAWGYAAQGGTNHVNCNIELLNPYLSKYTTYSGSYFIDNGAGSEIGTTQGFLANTTSYTNFTLTPAGQTFSSGTIRVYGYRNS